MESIVTSIKDPRIIEIRLLQTVAGRKSAQKCLIEGELTVLWAMNHHATFDSVFVHEKYVDLAVVKQLQEYTVPVVVASDGVMRKIHERSYLIPIIGVVKVPSLDHPRADFLVVLDDVKDLGNIGTIVRTAAAFDIHDFVMTDTTRDIWYQKVIDASRGTIFSAKVTHYASSQDTIDSLKKLGYRIVVTTPHEGSILQPFVRMHAQPTAIVVGNETEGVSAEFLAAADELVKIPMGASVESLNVGVAAGISLYELRLKWILAMLQHKIQNSLVRDFRCAAQWMRKIFDTKLRQSTPLTADQVVLLMVLACDRSAHVEKLLRDAGVAVGIDALSIIGPLQQLGYVLLHNDGISITPSGEEAIAQVWCVQQEVEEIALAGVALDELAVTKKVLAQIFENCQQVMPYDSNALDK